MSIFVVVDRLFKYDMFILILKDCIAKVTVKLFMSHMVKYWDLPVTIMSDRNSRFIGKFWMELFRLLGSGFNILVTMRP